VRFLRSDAAAGGGAMLKLGGVTDKTRNRSGLRGRGIVVTAAKQFKAHGMGYDINPERIKEAEENASGWGSPTVKFIERDLFQRTSYGHVVRSTCCRA